MITDDTLMLYFYADGLSETEHQAVRQKLEQSAQLRERYASLCQEMQGLADMALADDDLGGGRGCSPLRRGR